jgi:hypothetical protein
MKTKYLSRIDDNILWFRALTKDGYSYIRREDKGHWSEDRPQFYWSVEDLLALGYLPCPYMQATANGKIKVPSV